MAQTLHDTYGYSYDNLKVLLGGWNSWNDLHSTDPTGYPEINATPTPPSAVTAAPGQATSKPNTNTNPTITPIPIGIGTVIINVGGAGQTPQAVTPGAPVSAPAPSP